MLQEVSKLADRSRTFKTHGTGPEGRHSPYTRRFRLASKIHDAVPMFVDIEDCLGFAGVEPDLFCGCHQNVDASDVGSFPETGREDLSRASAIPVPARRRAGAVRAPSGSRG